MGIISHRGLNAYNQRFPESSFLAFENYLQQGYPIEFDANFLEEKILVTHESLSKFQNNKISKFSPSLSDIFSLIRKYKVKNNALHLKGKFQEKKYLDLLVKEVGENLDLANYFFIFDVTIETAKYLKSSHPNLKLAPSVAHEYDIARYGACVGNTLLSIDEVIKHKELFDWVWLDEWDRVDRDGKDKKFYTREVFDIFRKNNLKIALVTPELHASLPHVKGSVDGHEDAITREKLFTRIKEISALKPDLICTNYIRI